VKGREQAGPGGDYIPIGVRQPRRRKEKKVKEKTAIRRVRVRSNGNVAPLETAICQLVLNTILFCCCCWFWLLIKHLLVSHFRQASFTVGRTLKKSK
jgi:hypothetical protein